MCMFCFTSELQLKIVCLVFEAGNYKLQGRPGMDFTSIAVKYSDAYSLATFSSINVFLICANCSCGGIINIFFWLSVRG